MKIMFDFFFVGDYNKPYTEEGMKENIKKILQIYLSIFVFE